MSVCLVVSAGLSVCKALQFDINSDSPVLAFPLPFSQNLFRFGWQFNPRLIAITIINTITDIFNYFLFVLVHFIVDLVLLKKLQQVIREKESKMREMMKGVEKMEEKVSKETEESKRRAFYMVIANSMLNLITKVPSMITSMNDVRMLVMSPYEKHSILPPELFGYDPFKTKLLFDYFCSNDKSCLVFQHFGNCLFLVSICSVYYFLMCFDRNFKTAYKTVFEKKTKK